MFIRPRVLLVIAVFAASLACACWQQPLIDLSAIDPMSLLGWPTSFPDSMARALSSPRLWLSGSCDPT